MLIQKANPGDKKLYNFCHRCNQLTEETSSCVYSNRMYSEHSIRPDAERNRRYKHMRHDPAVARIDGTNISLECPSCAGTDVLISQRGEKNSAASAFSINFHCGNPKCALTWPANYGEYATTTTNGVVTNEQARQQQQKAMETEEVVN